MGWLEYRAECWKRGQIDRKAELIKAFTDDSETHTYEVLKCSMKGSVGYMAVKYTDKVSPEKNRVFGVVCLTSVSDRWFFAYKDMDETMGPGYYDCPKSIINLLTPTTNEYALEWRKRCLENASGDNISKQLSKAKAGSTLKMTYGYDTTLSKQGDEVILEKRCYKVNYHTGRSSYKWVSNRGYSVPTKMIADNKTEWINYIV